VDHVGAWTTLMVSGILFLGTALWVRTRAPRVVVDALLVVAGVGVGIGGLLFLTDVTWASWVAAPAVLAVSAVVHERALFAGTGPFRT
jgi:hypothetical protein